ncbi:hypothetical protein [uncultured Anaerococcus sp.]|uniref:hypothetical protein n=1 Tax=uncultured Anaerococcus sp. TaxID=293428 RepID=UPI00288A20C8|nr:hypothetical protein [uncultured Anaerococcus sp.]
MKLNKKIFSLTMIAPVSSTISVKPSFAYGKFTNPYKGKKTFSVINEDIEINHI